MICFVIALQSEANSLLDRVENLKEIKLADKKAYTCTLCGAETVIAISGIGKVSASLTTQLLIDKYSPTHIFNFGTCGGMNESVQILKYYAIEKCCQYDFDLSELDNVPVGYIQEYDTVYFNTYTNGLDFLEKRNLASADKFTNKEKDIALINSMNCSVCDMEGGAIAQVCTSNNVPLVMIKGISDVQGSGTAPEQFYKNLKAVGAGFPNVIINAVKSILK